MIKIYLQPTVWAGSGTNSMGGFYHEDGTHNGKSKYTRQRHPDDDDTDWYIYWAKLKNFSSETNTSIDSWVVNDVVYANANDKLDFAPVDGDLAESKIAVTPDRRSTSYQGSSTLKNNNRMLVWSRGESGKATEFRTKISPNLFITSELTGSYAVINADWINDTISLQGIYYEDTSETVNDEKKYIRYNRFGYPDMYIYNTEQVTNNTYRSGPHWVVNNTIITSNNAYEYYAINDTQSQSYNESLKLSEYTFRKGNTPNSSFTSKIQILNDVFPTINAIDTTAFSWGAVLNSNEVEDNGNVTVTTRDVNDDDEVTITLNGKPYTGVIKEQATTISIAANDLKALSNGGSYTLTADVSSDGRAAPQVESSAFTVRTTVPTINAIDTTAFSWGAVLNSNEVEDNGNVTVTTNNGTNNDTVKITLNGKEYDGVITNNSSKVIIAANDLKALSNGGSYTLTADVSSDGVDATQVVSSAFTVRTTVPTINAIDTTAFSWGAILNANEVEEDGFVTVTTNNGTNNDTVKITLNGKEYDGVITNDSSKVIIAANDLKALSNGGSYTLTADVSSDGVDAIQVVSSAFTVRTTVPTINAIDTTVFSWGAVLDRNEVNNNGSVTVTTNDVNDGQVVTITLNSKQYTGVINNNETTVTIGADDLKNLTNSIFTLTADVSNYGVDATQVESSAFKVPYELNNLYYSGTLSGVFADLTADKICFFYPDVKLGITSLKTESDSLLSIYGANVTLMKGSTFTTTVNSGIKNLSGNLVDVTTLPNENIYVWYIESNDFEKFDSRVQTSITSGVVGTTNVEKKQKYNTNATRFTQSAKRVMPVGVGSKRRVKIPDSEIQDLIKNLFGIENSPITDSSQAKTLHTMFYKSMKDRATVAVGEAIVPLAVINKLAHRSKQSKWHRTATPAKTTYTPANNTVPISTNDYVVDGDDDDIKMNFHTELEPNEIFKFMPLEISSPSIHVSIERIADDESGAEPKKMFKILTTHNNIKIYLVDENDDDNEDLQSTDGGQAVELPEDSIITVRHEEKERFLVITLGTVDGEEGGSGSSGTSGGDPYCEPIFGNPIKLPNLCANYRLFESNGLYINASVSPSTNEDKNRILEYLINNKYSQDVIDTAIYDGYFYDIFYISYKGEQLLIDLNSDNEPEVNNVFTVKKEQLTNSLKLVKNDKIGIQTVYKCYHEDHGKVEILVQKYYNPQIKNGISIKLDRNAKQAIGLLVYNYKPKFMTLPNVKVEQHKPLHRKLQKAILKSKNVYKIQHTVIEDNEVWVNKHISV